LINRFRTWLDTPPEPPLTKKKADLTVEWLGQRVTPVSAIPFRIGPSASTQDIQVAIFPPSAAPTTVSIIPSDPTIEIVIPATKILNFTAGDIIPKPVTVRVKAILTSARPAQVTFLLNGGGSAGTTAGLDPRLQGITVSPENISIGNGPDDFASLSVTLDAIIDSPSAAVVTMAEVTQDDPDPSKKLRFEPVQLPAQRLSPATHTSPPTVFKVRLVPRTTMNPIRGPLDDKKRKLADAVVTDGPASSTRSKNKAKISIDTNHFTTISLISAGKGDSYIISDSFGTGTAWTRMLVDEGGCLRNWAEHSSRI
jgi:hypothetical protein